MKIIDITAVTHPGFVTWNGGEQGYSLTRIARIAEGSVCNVSVIEVGAHTGTHIDAPYHFIHGGKTVESLDLNVLVGPVVVVDLTGILKIEAAHLERQNLLAGTTRIILKTDNTVRRLIDDQTFHTDYVGVAPSAAHWIVDHGIKLVGVDYLSVGPHADEENVSTHRILLGNEVVVLESLALNGVSPGEYTLVALPPKFDGLDGSPLRAILLENG